MSTKKSIRERISLFYGFKDPLPDYSTVVYSEGEPKDVETSQYIERIAYLKDVFQHEESRQATIENKISQLLGQSGIVFSLASLLIPLFYDKLHDYGLMKQIALSALFFASILSYMWSIHKTTQTFQINKFKYSTITAVTMLKYPVLSKLQEVLITDYIFACKTNTLSNNSKANKLIFANNAFKTGNVFMGILLVTFSFFIITGDQVKSASEVNIINLDSVIFKNSEKVLDRIESIQKENFQLINNRLDSITKSIQNAKKESVDNGN